MFSSVLVIVGRLEWGFFNGSSWPSLDTLLRFPQCDLEMKLSLKASWSIWSVSGAFFRSFVQNFIAVHVNAPSSRVTKSKKEKNTSRGGTSRSKLAAGCVGRADPSPHCPTCATMCKIMRITFIIDPVCVVQQVSTHVETAVGDVTQS